MKTSISPFLPLLLLSACFFTLVTPLKDCATPKKTSTSKLICYYSTVDEIDGCYCTHVILPSNADVKGVKRVRDQGVKVYVSVNEFNQGLIDLLKSSNVDGLEINLKKLDSKNDISDFISTIKTKIGSDLDIVLSVPSKSDLVAKYFNFKALSKYADLFVLQTAFLGASTNVTFHPSRLSGMWDMQNTDSMVDLVTGLGAPLSKLVITAPVQAFEFTLQSDEYTAPGSPAVELKSITRDELCRTMNGGNNWTLERDEDQTGPYIFRKTQWIAFEDPKSIDIKAKYSRVRGLAGIALKDLAQDGGAKCGSTILEATYNGLSRQARAPRGAVLHSLEREILESPSGSLASVQLSPFRISRIIDTEGKIHVTRQDSRTEFQCSRQGYFVHPRSCNRFYRCVKFDQRSDDFNVFEFDCPAGLAFDERVEVCVWPGSLPHGTPCSGSSEIAPVPRKRFECPSQPGYYADPENCRWFFACLDHGKSPLEAYEFRCPFGLGFDGEKLVCEWPWLVPKCASGVGLESDYYYGEGSGSNGGYSGTGTLSSGLVLQNYDGLGTLGAIKLGGISGKIDKPISTVYSNVGSGGIGLGYQNNGGYIVGGGLSYKAAQSLANAGLLKVNNGAGYQATGQDQLGTIYTTSQLDSGNANIQYLSGTYDRNLGSAGYATGSGHGAAVSTQGFSQNGADSSSFLINANGNYDSEANAYAAGQLKALDNLQYHKATGQYQDSNVQLIQGSLGGLGYGNTGTGYQNVHGQATGDSGNIGIQSVVENNGYGTSKNGILVTGYSGAAVPNVGYENTGYVTVTGSTGQGSSGYINSGSHVSGNADFASQYAYGNGHYQQGSQENADGGAVSTQSFTQYHGQQDNKAGSYDSGISGNINIIGGGYSAVGTLGGVHVSNNGDADDDVKTVSFSSTPSPISLTTYAPVVASVPTVTAIPVPGIKTAAGFETFKGGVIANIPALQYKVKSHGDVGFLANISSSFANFVVTSPPTIPNEVIQQSYSQDGGYVYNKPNKVFEEGALNTISVSTARPFITVSTEEPKVYVSSTVKPILAQGGYVYEEPNVVHSTLKPTVTYQKYDTNGGYKYERPSVVFEEKPHRGIVVDAYSTISTPKPVVYVAQQPQVYVSSTPVAPSAVSSYSFTQETNQNQGGYYYNKPGIAFEEVPSNPAIISKFSIRKPIVQKTVNTGSYYYEKPVVVAQQPAVLNQIPAVQLKYQPAQSAIASNYYYQQPVVQQQPIVPLYQQPELLSTYTYQPPVQKAIYKQPVSIYTYQNVAQESLGLTYAKPQVTLVSNPAPTYSYQPSAENSYQYIKFENNRQAPQPQGYEYPKPAVAFQEEPKVGVVSAYQYPTPTPKVIIQETKAQEGYFYEKPAQSVTYSTPKPIIAVQPAVVNSYFSIGSGKSVEAAVEQNYPQTVAYSTPKPFSAVQPVTPAVVTRYVNIESSTPKPEVVVQPITYSTPKPVVVQPVIGYSYPKPDIKFEERPVRPAVVASYNYIGSTTPQPNIIVEEQQPVNYISKPQVVVEHKPAVVTSYFHQQPSQPDVISTGYDYPKPSVQFVEEAHQHQEVPFVKNTAYVTGEYQQNYQDNYINQHFLQGNYQNTGKIAVENYVNPNYQTVKQTSVYHQQPQVVLNYVQSTPKPSFVSTIKSIVTKNIQPKTPTAVTFYDSRYTAVTPQSYESATAAPEIQIVSTTSRPILKYSLNDQYQYNQNVGLVKSTSPEPISYDYISSTTPQPKIILQQETVSYTPKPNVYLEQNPAVVSSYYNQQHSQPAVSKGYSYPKPAVQFVEEPQSVVTSYDNREPSVQEVPFIKKTAYVTGDYQQTAQENYKYQQNTRGNYQQTGKVIVENYVRPNYETIGQNVYQQQGNIQYHQPQVVLNYVQSTPKPSFVSTIKSIVTQPITPATVTFYDSRYTAVTPQTYYESATAAPEIQRAGTTSRPTAKYSFSSLDDQYQYNQQIDLLKTVTPEPTKAYLPVTSRVRVTSALPKIEEEFVVPEVTTLTRDHLPARIRTKAPAKEYLPVEISTPSREYLPSRQRVVVTTAAPEVTTLFREYLPVRSRVRITTTGAPLYKALKPVTVIKQNDAHPLLSAKLGAQCTCVSNSLRLRKKQKIIIVDDDDQNGDDDGYVVDDGSEGAIVENYSYEPQRVVNIAPTLQVYVQSTSEASLGYIKKRVKVRPVVKQSYLPVTEASDVFYKKDYTLDDSVPSDKEIVKAVRTGLKLVKQAAKEGAREGTEDALSGKQFDRYGPGGVRSRSETLQGSIDCQRAGLFRHPTECNKFYACRWDCTKNRFTLHIFNCPVQLTFDNTVGACNWPSQGPACVENTLIISD